MVQPVKIAKMRANQNGFSLIELAVVLAIIGLLAGGIVATNSYLQGAQLKTVVNEGKYYINAWKQFEAKYGGALPGDMANATDYWSTAANGDGNGLVSESSTEPFYLFKHLQLAGLISGDYTGVAGSAGPYHAVPGENVPKLAMDGLGGQFAYAGEATAADPGNFEGLLGTPFTLGRSNGSGPIKSGYFTPTVALELDTKFDDGQPDKGWIRGRKNQVNCVSGTTYYVASPSPGRACALLLLNQ